MPVNEVNRITAPSISAMRLVAGGAGRLSRLSGCFHPGSFLPLSEDFPAATI